MAFEGLDRWVRSIQDDFWVGAGLNIWLDGDINAHDWKSLSLLGKVIVYIWTLLFVGINGVSRDTQWVVICSNDEKIQNSSTKYKKKTASLGWQDADRTLGNANI